MSLFLKPLSSVKLSNEQWQINDKSLKPRARMRNKLTSKNQKGIPIITSPERIKVRNRSNCDFIMVDIYSIFIQFYFT